MHLFAGLIISGLMIGLPLAFQSSIPPPPEHLTGWLLFFVALGRVYSLIRIFMTKMIIIPAIETAIKAAVADIPTRTEFNAHVQKDDSFQHRVEGFLENYYEGDGIDHRHGARRRGDPQ